MIERQSYLRIGLPFFFSFSSFNRIISHRTGAGKGGGDHGDREEGKTSSVLRCPTRSGFSQSCPSSSRRPSSSSCSLPPSGLRPGCPGRGIKHPPSGTRPPPPPRRRSPPLQAGTILRVAAPDSHPRSCGRIGSGGTAHPGKGANASRVPCRHLPPRRVRS
jgi:hypothetical protein